MVNAFDAVFADGERLRNSIRSQESGIFQNFLGDEVLERVAPSGVMTGRASFWLGVFLLPPLTFFLVAWGTQHWRLTMRDPKAARAARAYARFRSGLRTMGTGRANAATAAELQVELQRYFGDRFGMAPRAVEGQDVTRVLKEEGVDAAVGERIVEFWEGNDARRYSPTGANGDEVGSVCGEMPGLIAKVEKGLKS
jgi:hypothetical protein